jgi:hypothetical protein
MCFNAKMNMLIISHAQILRQARRRLPTNLGETRLRPRDRLSEGVEASSVKRMPKDDSLFPVRAGRDHVYRNAANGLQAF